MFKIYQIHEFGGEFEDAYDEIRGTYLKREKAEARKLELEKEEKEAQKCNNCPMIYYGCTEKEVKKYCKRYEPFDSSKHDPEEVDDYNCVNFEHQLYNSRFRIEEVEVEE